MSTLRENLLGIIRDAAASGRGRLDSDEWLEEDIAAFTLRLDVALTGGAKGIAEAIAKALEEATE